MTPLGSTQASLHTSSLPSCQPKGAMHNNAQKVKADSAHLKHSFLGAKLEQKCLLQNSLFFKTQQPHLLKPAGKADEKSMAFDCKPVKMIVTVVH